MAKKAYTIEPEYVPVGVTITPTDRAIADEIAIVWSGDESDNAAVRIDEQAPIHLTDRALQWLCDVGIPVYFARRAKVNEVAKSK